MFPTVYEKTLSVREFAAFLGCSYYAARRLLIRHGGYRNIGNGNERYESRRVPISRAEKIKEDITKRGR
jgi:hypothetical protein